MKRYVIFDVDGTLTKDAPGSEPMYVDLKPEDYASFYEKESNDIPNETVINLVKVLIDSHYNVVFCTARPEMFRAETTEFISKHVYGNRFLKPKKRQLLMRADDDLRDDAIVKLELVRDAGINFEDIAFVVDDKESVVAAWRRHMVLCFEITKNI